MHQGPKAALGEGGSAHGFGRRRHWLGPSQQGMLHGSSFSRVASVTQRQTHFAPACVVVCREAWGRAKVAQDGDKSTTRRKDRAGGTKPEHQTPPAQTTMLDTHPFSLNTTVSILTLPFCTKGVVRVTTGNVVILSAALRAMLGTAVCSAPHCTPWCAALHSPSSCNTCSPSGCFISLDQK